MVILETEGRYPSTFNFYKRGFLLRVAKKVLLQSYSNCYSFFSCGGTIGGRIVKGGGIKGGSILFFVSGGWKGDRFLTDIAKTSWRCIQPTVLYMQMQREPRLVQ